MAGMTTAAGYVRVSTEEQAREGISLNVQRERVAAYCSMAGLTLAATFEDAGVSGSEPLANRHGGGGLLASVESGTAKHVVALKLDRLFRDAEDALRTVRRWDRRGVSLHLVDMGGQTLNTASAMGRLFLTMTAAFAELERNLIRERTSAALTFKRDRRQVYGPVPLGYVQDGARLAEDAGELELVARIRSLREQGQSLRDIAGALNDEGIPGKRGGTWHPSTVRYVLGNPLYASNGRGD